MSELLKKKPIPYEPKKKNRWLFRMTPIITKKNISVKLEEWVYVSGNRPKFKKKPFWLFWSKLKVEPFWLLLRDPIGPSTTSAIYQLIENNAKIDYELEMLDPTGVAVEKWELKGCQILEVDFGELNYQDDDTMICKLLIKPKTAKLVF